MKIYTKTGDQGTTSLANGKRHEKTEQVFSTLGEIDTLNAMIGHLISLHPEFITEGNLIQKKLLSLSSEIAKAQNVRNQVLEADTSQLEQRIDYFSDNTHPLKHLILPGGSTIGSYTHIIRSQARKVERSYLNLIEKPENPNIEAYLNRLSDYFFALARYINQSQNQPEIEWK